MRYAISCLIFFSLIFTACTQQKDGCCIRVGQTCITTEEFCSRLERFAEESMIDSKADLDRMKPVLVDNMVEEMLVLQYAADNQIIVSEQEVDIAIRGIMDGIKKEDMDRMFTEECRTMDDIQGFVRKHSIINKTIDRAVGRKIVVDDTDIEAFYKDNRSDYMRPASVELYHVFTKEKTKARIALSMLRSGTSLGYVVHRYSVSSDAKDNGFMGVFVRGELPDKIESVVFSLPERRFSRIIKTMSGYHIFYVENKAKPGMLGIEEVSDKIRQELMDERFEKEYALWIKGLMEKYKPEVNYDKIKKISVNQP
ncbi:MAG: peptidyl-prolyl cis-trans isomerase [Thermodesulfobacteriota bacterium]|nr:peptidyl-prolyl cis-trans isomerase [Thermodesulfobacteriota bacterium]